MEMLSLTCLSDFQVLIHHVYNLAKRGKGQKGVSLFLIFMLIPSATATVYNYMDVQSLPISAEGAEVQFVTATDSTEAGAVIGTNGTYVKFTSVAGWPNATKVYEEAVGIYNPHTSPRTIEIKFDSWSGDTTSIDYIYVKIFNATTHQQGSTIEVGVTDSSTGEISIPASTTWRVQLEIKWQAGALSSNTVSVALEVYSKSTAWKLYHWRASPVPCETPKVVLQSGTAGTSTIYTNNTSARVNVAAAIPTYDFVDNNASDVDSSADKGKHSNFANEQAGPDSTYDTLTEENTFIFAMEWGTVSVNDTFETIDLVNSYISPVIICVPFYTSGVPRTPRLRNVSSTSFEVRVQNPSGEACPTTMVHYIVVEEGVWSLPDGRRLEASTYNTNTVGENNNWAYDTRNYGQFYSGNLIVLHQVMTYNDPGWITTYCSKSDSRTAPPSSADSGFRIALNGAEAVDSHGTETIGYIIIEEGYGTLNGTKYDVKRTADFVQGFDNAPPYYTAFSQGFSAAPEVVISIQLEMDGGNGGWLVDHTVNQTHCGLMVDEDQVLDAERSHIDETCGFWAFENAGNFTESYVRAMEWGTVLCTDENYQTVNLINTYTNPVVVCSPQYSSGVPTGVIVRNVTSSSFEVKLDRPEGGFSGSRTVHYIACEEGSFTLPDGRRVIAGSVTTTKYGYTGTGNWENFVTVNFTSPFDNPPVVFHTRVTEDTANWYVTFCRSTTSRSEPPTTSSMGIAFNCGQLGTGTVNDTLHYITVDPGYGTLNGVKYDVKRTADAIEGFAEAPPYSTAFDQGFTSTPAVCAVTQLEMDGSNGGWALLYSINSTHFGMAIDETLETDRSHTTEMCGSWAFETTGSWSTANYELDLEVQWTGVDYDEENEYVCIYVGTMGDEDLGVDYWNGSSWSSLFIDLTANSWNNISVPLTSTDFTIRFKGGAETADATQDSWNIDATLLHVWTDTYDHVLKVVNQVTDAWNVSLKVYDSSNIARLSNTTISFHDGTTSDQIIVSGGNITQSEGTLYDLAGSTTIYISMSNVQASTSGTSYLYIYLKILVPDTSTYNLFVITFEIT